MEKNQNLKLVKRTALTLILAALALPGFAQQPTAAEHAAMLKATLAASQAVLRQYEWIETTVVSVKGDEKSRKQERCYYGADGAVQKVVLTQSAPPPRPRGFLRGRIAAKKSEEMTDSMQSAVSLVKAYMPPSPVRLQAAKDSGRVGIDILEPGRRARLNFRSYVKTGDNLGVEVDLVTNRPLGIKVSTYLDDATDAVTLDVRMGQLNDSTTYPSDITLEARAKEVTVSVKASGYRKM